MTVVGNCFRPTLRGSVNMAGSSARITCSDLSQRLIHFSEQHRSPSTRIHFVLDCVQLFRRELLAAQVSGETFDAARDMPQLKSDRREAVRPQPDLVRR